MIKRKLNRKLQLACVACSLLAMSPAYADNNVLPDVRPAGSAIGPVYENDQAKGIQVNGTVRDSQGEPLPGVNTSALPEPDADRHSKA